VTVARGLLVLEPGLLTTVQDLGRSGWASFGVPAAGALDEEALRLANRLVGNAENSAALEITLVGPVLRAAGDLDVAVVGGAFGPASGRAVRVADGEVISLASSSDATRAIAAVGGGIDVPLVLGSRSTCVSGRFGGFQGRRLQRGDFLAVFPASTAPLVEASADLRQPGDGDLVLRAFGGSDEVEFDAGAREAFWRSSWRILPESNRMGLRLSGPSLGLVETASRASEGTTRGTVQVTADGHPIVLLAERPTTGGYPKMAVVAAVDLDLLARTPPGRIVRFERISVTDARGLVEEREARLRAFPGGRG
jgi:antagonist of KipI